MSKHIDEIMRISDKGYADNFEDIKDILENFMSYTVEEVSGVLPGSYSLKLYSDEIIQKLGNIPLADDIDEAYTGILRLSDLFCTMRYFDKTQDFMYNPLLSYMKGTYRYIRDAQNLTWVKLFQSISVKSLMDFFGQTVADNSKDYSRIYKSICLSAKNYASFEMTDTATVNQLFKGIRDELYSSWNPGYSQSEYYEKIERCVLILKHIFVDGLGTWYYDRFDITELTNRIYSKIDELELDDIDDFELDFDDIDL